MLYDDLLAQPVCQDMAQQKNCMMVIFSEYMIRKIYL